jgi:hypothetical protein
MASLITQTLRATALALVLLGAAQAQQTATLSEWRGFAGVQTTYGGDTMLFGLTASGTETGRIQAGSGIMVTGGAEYTISPEWYLSGSLAYHFHYLPGTSGSAMFSRWPVELISSYRLSPEIKIGVGVRKTLGARLSVDSNNVYSPIDTGAYESTTAAVFQAEVFPTEKKNFSITGRYVKEGLRHKNSARNYNADHVGIGFMTYF